MSDPQDAAAAAKEEIAACEAEMTTIKAALRGLSADAGREDDDNTLRVQWVQVRLGREKGGERKRIGETQGKRMNDSGQVDRPLLD
jgi:hypothetical protein